MANITAPPKRSPAYPSLDLATAIKRADQFHSGEGRNPTPIETAVRHWGYKNGPNGATNLIVSSLKKYGLVNDSGSGSMRIIQITDLAIRILQHPEPGEQLAAIQRAALIPRIHREMWEKYHLQMPSNESFIWMLKTERDFTDSGAKDFVKEYRATIAFSQLGQSEAEDPALLESSGDQPDEGSDDDSDERQRSPMMERALDDIAINTARLRNEAAHREREKAAQTPPAGMTAVPVPLPGGGAIILQAALPISEANWKYFTGVLDAMKDGLVTRDQPTE